MKRRVWDSEVRIYVQTDGMYLLSEVIDNWLFANNQSCVFVNK